MKGKRLLSMLALLVVLSLVAVPSAAAQDNPPQPTVRGQVMAIDGAVITVHTRDGEVEIITTDETIFRLPGVDEPGLDDIAVNDLIAAVGVWNDDGSLQARGVLQPREMERQARLTGEVAAIDGANLTVALRGEREIVLLTDEETVFQVPDVAEPTLADLQAGDRVIVQVQARDGTPYARVVIVPPDDAARLNGQVSAIEGATLLIEADFGAVRVLTDDETLFRVPGVEEATLADVAVGTRVSCGGQWESVDGFHASVVAVLPESQTPGQACQAQGWVTSVGGDSLTLGTPRGPLTVRVSAETTLRVAGIEAPTLADIPVGERAGVRGRWNEDGSLQATGVALLDDAEGATNGSSPGARHPLRKD